MKKITQFGLMLLVGLSSAFSIAEEKTTPPQNEVHLTEQTVEKIDAKKVALNPNLVNINTATAAELQDKLVGIGAKKAQAIVEYREKNGRFVNLEQITEVVGIGNATLEKNRDRIILE